MSARAPYSSKMSSVRKPVKNTKPSFAKPLRSEDSRMKHANKGESVVQSRMRHSHYLATTPSEKKSSIKGSVRKEVSTKGEVAEEIKLVVEKKKETPKKDETPQIEQTQNEVLIESQNPESVKSSDEDKKSDMQSEGTSERRSSSSEVGDIEIDQKLERPTSYRNKPILPKKAVKGLTIRLDGINTPLPKRHLPKISLIDEYLKQKGFNSEQRENFFDKVSSLPTENDKVQIVMEELFDSHSSRDLDPREIVDMIKARQRGDKYVINEEIEEEVRSMVPSGVLCQRTMDHVRKFGKPPFYSQF